MYQPSVPSATAGTTKTFLALVAIISLLLTMFAAAGLRPSPALATGEHCPGGDNGAPSGAMESASGDASEQNVSITWSGDPGTVTITNNNTTTATVVFCAKGGTDFDGDSKNSGEITAVVAPGETLEYDFGTEISYFVLYSVEVEVESETNGQLEVVKVVDPSDDATEFSIGYTGDVSDSARGPHGTSTGKDEVTAGDYTIVERPVEGYDASIRCVLRDTDTVVGEGDGTSLDIEVMDGQDVLCTITNVLDEEVAVPTVMVMKHLCDDVSSLDEFLAIEQAARDAQDNDDLDELAALAATVVACPTIVESAGDVQTPGALAGGQADFNFDVTDDEGSQLLEPDGTFVQAQLCTDDLPQGIQDQFENEAGDNICLDISHYAFEIVDGEVTVEETLSPDGAAFGVLRLTPGSDDPDAVKSDLDDPVIELDTTADGDGMVMLHVYNFTEETQPGGGTLPNQGGPKPAEGTKGSQGGPSGGQLPNTSTDVGGSMPAVLLAVTLLAGLGLGGYRMAEEARRRR